METAPAPRIRRRRRRVRARAWVFTVFAFHANHLLTLRALGRGEDPIYSVVGREICPTTGRRHLQGYIRFARVVALSGVRRILGPSFANVHFEVARGSPQQNISYCTKDGDSEAHGDPPAQGSRNDLTAIQGEIEAGLSELGIASQYFSRWIVYRHSFERFRELLREPSLRMGIRVNLIIGTSGAGKTRYVWEKSRAVGASLWISSDPTLKWFDGYDGQTWVLLDDYRGGADYEFLLRLLDIYPLLLPIKGSYTPMLATTIWITSNVEPDVWYVPPTDLSPLRRRITKIARISDASCPTWDSVKTFLDRCFPE